MRTQSQRQECVWSISEQVTNCLDQGLSKEQGSGLESWEESGNQWGGETLCFFLQAQLLRVLGFLWGPIANVLSLICMLEMLLQCDYLANSRKSERNSNA